ncbi:MAG: hypothetical protein GEV10_04185 [Streptosporangiales bacterium]|nr:hypothetical protein [Streptosporangiales bacterium]
MTDDDQLTARLKRQHGIITRTQARAAGMSPEALRWRTRSGGPWQVLLRCVYACFTGEVTEVQRYQAALLHAGIDDAVLTGRPALRLQGFRDVAEPDLVPVLIPHGRRTGSVPTVTIMRTRRPPTGRPVERLTVAEPVRATVDACRTARELDDVRGLTMQVLGSRRVGIEALAHELTKGDKRGTAYLHQALADYGEGVRSVAEADARDRLLRLDLPVPLFNPDLYLPDGTFLARPDAYWPDAALAFEVDSLLHHGDFDGLEHTQRRHARMSAHGVTTMHASPRRIGGDWPVLAGELGAAYHHGLTRPRPRLVVRPCT